MADYASINDFGKNRCFFASESRIMVDFTDHMGKIGKTSAYHTLDFFLGGLPTTFSYATVECTLHRIQYQVHSFLYLYITSTKWNY